MLFNEFVDLASSDLTTFFNEINDHLIQKGYRCKIKEAKSGPVVSYTKNKKTLMNYVCRKTGIKARLYGAHVGQYQDKLNGLPEIMKKEIIKATDCKRLNGLSCAPNCPGGYIFIMDGMEYKKCRSMAFMHTLDNQSIKFVRELILAEVYFCENEE